MKTLTVRLPDAVVSEIEEESRKRKVSKSDVVRDRLTSPARSRRRTTDSIADLIGSVRGLPPDLSSRKKKYLETAGYGRKPAR
jgi:Arc/MetJ-type ribon-helix-helix transcriptional regulator